jgi:hypothetical protein
MIGQRFFHEDGVKLNGDDALAETGFFGICVNRVILQVAEEVEKVNSDLLVREQAGFP